VAAGARVPVCASCKAQIRSVDLIIFLFLSLFQFITRWIYLINF
jgi:hypothetical protein